MMTRHRKQYGKVMVLVLLVLCWGCAADKSARKDQFFEKWDTAAKESEGHSPVARRQTTILSQDKPSESGVIVSSAIKEEEPPKALSSERVTLKMRQADVKAVIRALARVAGKNILIKNDVKGDISVDFANVPWDQAFNSILRTQGLSYVLDGDIIRILSLEDMETSAKLVAVQEKNKTQVMEGKRSDALVTMIVNVDYADAQSLRDNLQDFLTKDKDGKPLGSVKVDKHSNALIIQAIGEDVKRMTPLIERLDKPTHQINIKANIVETTKGLARSLGIQWGGMYGGSAGNHSMYITPGGRGGSTSVDPLTGAYKPTAGGTGTSGSIGGASGTGIGIGGQGLGVNFPAVGLTETASASLGLIFGTIGGNILEAQLSALQSDNKLNILSSPSITTLDNQMAFTENGEKIPYVTTSTSGSGSGTTQTVNFENAVLRLEITPHVIDGRNLKMKILVKKDEVDTSRSVQGNPFIIKKQTETSLIVQDGETIVISGLSKKTTGGGVSGVPWLKDIPVFGWLFKNKSDSEQLQEVLIFITPKILPPPLMASVSGDGQNAGEPKP